MTQMPTDEQIDAAYQIMPSLLRIEIKAMLDAALAAPRPQDGAQQDEREACPQCNGERWIVRGNGEDAECEACLVDGGADAEREEFAVDAMSREQSGGGASK